MALSLHTDSPLSDLRCCLYLQLSLRFFSAADTSRLLSLHYTTLSRFVHTTRFSPLCSLRLCVLNTALLYSTLLFSAFSLASAVLFTTLPYTQHCCAAFGRLARYVSLSLFSSSFLVLPFLYALFSRFLPCRSLFFVLFFLASQQFFCRLASHAFIHFFPRLILLRFYACHVFRFVSCLRSSLVSLPVSS